MSEDREFGDCYEANGKYIIYVYLADSTTSFNIAFGEVVGQKDSPVEGIRFIHCWLEINEVVVDNSNGKQVSISKEKYYKLGKIKNVKVFNAKEYANSVLKTSSYYPFDDEGGIVNE